LKIVRNIFLFYQLRLGYSFTEAEKKHAEEFLSIGPYSIFDKSNFTIMSKHNIAIGIAGGLTFKLK